MAQFQLNQHHLNSREEPLWTQQVGAVRWNRLKEFSLVIHVEACLTMSANAMHCIMAIPVWYKASISVHVIMLGIYLSWQISYQFFYTVMTHIQFTSVLHQGILLKWFSNITWPWTWTRIESAHPNLLWSQKAQNFSLVLPSWSTLVMLKTTTLASSVVLGHTPTFSRTCGQMIAVKWLRNVLLVLWAMISFKWGNSTVYTLPTVPSNGWLLLSVVSAFLNIVCIPVLILRAYQR